MDKLADLKRGSYKEFQSLYELYFDSLYRYIYGLVHSHTLAKEIVQDTFIKVWIHREQIDLTLSFKSYLFKIAKNQLVDKFRRQMRDPLFEDYMTYSENATVMECEIEKRIDFDEFNRLLICAKKKLTPRQCEVFELAKEDGLSTCEIAQRMNISEQAVYNLLSQSLASLRKELTPYYTLFAIFFF